MSLWQKQSSQWLLNLLPELLNFYPFQNLCLSSLICDNQDIFCAYNHRLHSWKSCSEHKPSLWSTVNPHCQCCSHWNYSQCVLCPTSCWRCFTFPFQSPWSVCVCKFFQGQIFLIIFVSESGSASAGLGDQHELHTTQFWMFAFHLFHNEISPLSETFSILISVINVLPFLGKCWVLKRAALHGRCSGVIQTKFSQTKINLIPTKIIQSVQVIFGWSKWLYFLLFTEFCYT